jgi:putative FmdB family regulatory protein
MPLYDYHCPTCGDFRAWRRMSEAREPVVCSNCDGPAARAMVAPQLALMPSNSRIAHQRNEKSADEPKVVSRSQMGDGEHPHRHAHHHHGHGHKHGAGGRPWMIGH